MPLSHTWTDSIREFAPLPMPSNGRYLIGVLEGEGVGPEVIGATLRVLGALEETSSFRFEVRRGGVIGRDAEAVCGQPLSAKVVDFCSGIFAERGAILAGPGGGRFVYDLRRRFDLFCKISPLETIPELANAGRMKPEHVRGVDCLLIRDNIGGIYQGEWRFETGTRGRRAVHEFSYYEEDVTRLLRLAVSIASRRRGILTVIHKDSGIPTVSELWKDVAEAETARAGIKLMMVNVDYAAYQLVQHAQELDVVVSPNLMGDVLADVSSVVLGSRALSYSGNFGPTGESVYQTNHGAAYDIAGTGMANPAGQIYSLCMLLAGSFGLTDLATRIETALREVWKEGCRTADLPERGCRLATTSQIADLVCETILAPAPETVA